MKLIRGFKELRDELVSLQDDLYERRIFEYFDLISWLDSKIENRLFDEIVREKAGKVA